MVDYVAVLRRTIGALPKNSPEIRERVYVKARTTVESKLAMINPPPSQALIARQMSGLEAAIATVEADFTIADGPDVWPAVIVQETDPLMDVLRGLPSLAEVTSEGKAPTPFRMPAVESPDFEPPYVVPAPALAPANLEEAPQPARLPQAATLQNNELPRQNDSFDDIFGQQVERPVSLPFAAPTLDEPVVLPAFSRRARPKAKPGRLLFPLVGLALFAGIGALAWTERDTIIALLKPEQAPVLAPQADAAAQPAAEPAAEPAVTPAQTGDAVTEPAQNSAQKFTQRLNTDGTEVDAGAGTAGGAQSVAQLEPSIAPAEAAGTVAPLVETPVAGAEAPPSTAVAEPAAGAIAVGQKAIFYEERTSGSEGSARSGDVVWSVVRESPGNDRPPEAAVRGELSIPEAGLNVRMTLRRNADATLPASHILELIMTVPDDFSGGTIEDVQRVNLKPTEESAGAPLAATPVKVADKYFLVALENTPAVVESNLKLLRDQSWIDLPVVYRSGRRALFTMEKGLIGDQVFKEVIDAWAAAPLQ